MSSNQAKKVEVDYERYEYHQPEEVVLPTPKGTSAVFDFLLHSPTIAELQWRLRRNRGPYHANIIGV